jgi:hypothetical protein
MDEKATAFSPPWTSSVRMAAKISVSGTVRERPMQDS